MRTSLSWLREYAVLDAPVDELVAALVDSGTEVDAVERQAEGIVVARVLDLQPVPESTRGVRMATIDAGTGTPVRLLTGAPNLTAGDLVPWAPPGTVLPGRDEPLGVRAMFGGKYQSPGMLCSAEELALGDDAAGILVLDRGVPGQPLHEALGLDTILEVEPTTNRPDCMCHLGVARELAAVLGESLREPEQHVPEHLVSAASAAQRLSVEVTDDGCPRFAACVIEGVRVGPSPAWLQTRLRAIGLRPINNVVDVTNFVLHELGQPLHAFDLDRFVIAAGGGVARVVVRRGRGERLECLDGAVRELGPDDLAVCAGDAVASVGGVIGGRPTAVDETTRTVLLEAASWDPRSIRATSRRLGVRTDASGLYEKGLPDTLPPLALARAAHLIAELGGGFVLRDPVDVRRAPLAPPEPIEVDIAWVAALLGTPVDSEEAVTALARLGFVVDHDGDGPLRVRPPAFRRDVRLPEDVAEEVGRMLGYARVPATLPGRRVAATVLADAPDPEEGVADLCVGAGFDEVVTYSFTSPRRASLLAGAGGARAPLPLRNPLSEEWSVMRTSALPGLCEAVATNVRRGAGDVAVFELGRVFWDGARTGVAPGTRAVDVAAAEAQPLPAEPLVLALAVHAHDAAGGAAAVRRLQSVLWRLGEEVSGSPVEAAPGVGGGGGAAAGGAGCGDRAGALGGLRPGRSGVLLHRGATVGVIGEVDAAASDALDVRGRVAVAEVLLDQVLPARPRVPHYAVPPRLPAVVQDLAVVVPAVLTAGEALATIAAAGAPLLERAELYDEYRGERFGVERKGWTFRLTYRAPDRTLTGAEAQEVHTRIAAAMRDRHGAEVRG